MSNFNFYYPAEVRYGDLDPQGHVNNAKYLTYFEHARIHYRRQLKLFHEGQSFMDIGVILADLHITFKAPIQWGRKLNVGVRTTRLGKKSMTVEHCIMDADSGEVYATGEVVLVAYDYRLGKSIIIPEDWREKISSFEKT
jgi:acyl-CoA thioester hydrolase